MIHSSVIWFPLYACLSMIVISSRALAQTSMGTRDWSFEGVSSIDHEALRSRLRDFRHDSSIDSMQDAISARLAPVFAAHGFFDWRIDSISTAAAQKNRERSIIFIHEKNRAALRQVVLRGNEAMETSEALAALELSVGEWQSNERISSGIASLLRRYETRGYPFATVAVEDVRLIDSAGSTFLDLALRVEEFDLFSLAEVSVEGNDRTDQDLIVRAARVRLGEPFDASTTGDVRRRLERLDFFSSVDDPHLYQRAAKNGLLLRVAEGNTNAIDGIIGYQPPRSESESGTIVGMVSVSFRNLFGTGRQIAARWERAARDVQEIDLRYREPWILSLPIDAETGFFQRQQDTTYVSRAFDAKLSLEVTEFVRLNLLGSTYSVIPSALTGINPIARSATWNAGVEIAIDTRDNVFSPTAGVMFRNAYTGGNKSITRASSTSGYVQHLTLDAAYFQTLFARNVGMIALHGREVRSGFLDAADLYRVGGAKSLRGYREEQFRGSRVVWSTIEYRYLLGKKTFAFAFVDYGNIFIAANAETGLEGMNQWKSGYGFGMRLETALGIVAVSYALGAGDGVTDGKIHFGLVNDF